MFRTILRKTQVAHQEPTPYATRADFCRIFQDDMDRLYSLSLLLTGDHATAEKCFVSGLRMSREGNHVFKEWAQSWARRAIVLNAIRMIRPRITDESSSPASDASLRDAATEPAEISEIMQLPVFDRFAFVMSVLEHYSDHECAILLGSTRSDLIAARTRALQQLGRAARLRNNVLSIDANAMREIRVPQLQSDSLSRLAASA